MGLIPKLTQQMSTSMKGSNGSNQPEKEISGLPSASLPPKVWLAVELRLALR